MCLRLPPQHGALVILVTLVVLTLFPQGSCGACAPSGAHDVDASVSICPSSTAAFGLEREREGEEGEESTAALEAQPLALLQRASSSLLSRFQGLPPHRPHPPAPALTLPSPQSPAFTALSTLQTLEQLVAHANASLRPRAVDVASTRTAAAAGPLQASREPYTHANPAPSSTASWRAAPAVAGGAHHRSQLQVGLLALREGVLLGEAKAARREAERLRREEGELRRQNLQLRRALHHRAPAVPADEQEKAADTKRQHTDKELEEDGEEDGLDELFGDDSRNSTEHKDQNKSSQGQTSGSNHYSFFSSRLFWVVSVGMVTLLVLCLCFWVLECAYFHNFDENGDGEVEMDEAMKYMKKYMSWSWTTARAGGVCITVSGTVFTLLWWAGVIQLLLTQMLVYFVFAVAISSAVCIFIYHIYLNITSMMGSLFKEVKDMIQGVINFLEEKAEAAAEEMEKLTGTMGILAQDSPGMYVIKSRCDLQKTEKLDSQILQQLDEDMLVNVMKVKTRLADNRIRGLVESPKGWISIQNMETGFRWADKKEYQRGYFKVAVDSLPVTTNVDLDSPEAFKPKVKGDVVRVTEVRHRMREGVVRGHIAEGWITLLDLQTSRHKVEPWKVHRGIVPGFEALSSCGAAGPRRQASAEDGKMPVVGDIAGLRDVERDPFLIAAT